MREGVQLLSEKLKMIFFFFSFSFLQAKALNPTNLKINMINLEHYPHRIYANVLMIIQLKTREVSFAQK